MIDSRHPRAISLKIRDKVVKGAQLGITSLHGLIAQGRGEAFDYLIGEQTQDFANEAMNAAAAMFVLAQYPVLSVNGSSAALCPTEYVQLSMLLNCPIEVNLFHRTLKREKKIQQYLKKFGAKNIVGVGKEASEEIANIASKRKLVSPYGIKKADVVLVPLEDGDRTEALIALGKKVITIDLNPLSRTAQKASITIVDNIVRAMPKLLEKIKEYKFFEKEKLEKIIKNYNKSENIERSFQYMLRNLST